MASIVEEANDTYMTPAIIVSPEPESGNMKPGPWSEWYETRDQKRFWRARRLPDDTWGYQFSDIKPSSSAPKPSAARQKPPPTANATNSNRMASFFFGVPIVITPPPSQHRPASIYPPPPKDTDDTVEAEAVSTVTTTTNNSRDRGHLNPHFLLPRDSGTTFPSAVSTGKGRGSSLSILSSEKVSTLSKHEEDSIDRPNHRHNKTANNKSRGGASKLAPSSKAATHKTKSKANKPGNTNTNPTNTKNNNTIIPGNGNDSNNNTKPRPTGITTTATTNLLSLSLSKPRPPPKPPAPPAAGTSPSPSAAAGKKLHNKVKNEKEMRIDTKKRVKNWLKDVEPETLSSASLDEQGLPVYR
jgi:hypothetical protein